MWKKLSIGLATLGATSLAPVVPVEQEWLYAYDKTLFSQGEITDGQYYALEDRSGYVAHINGKEEFSTEPFKGLEETTIIGYEPKAVFAKRDGTPEEVSISRKELTDLNTLNIRPTKTEGVSLVSLLTTEAKAAIAYDASTGFRDGPTTSLTYAHTNAGSVVVTGGTSINDTVTGISYNAVAGTFVNKSSYPGAGRTGITVYYNTSPATGSNNVNITSSASVFIGGATNSYSGAGAPEASAVANVTGVSGVTCTVTTLTANAWVASFAANSQDVFTAGAGTTIRQNDPNYGSADGNGAVVTPGSTSLNMNYGSNGSAGCVIVSLPAVAAATADPNDLTWFELVF